MNTRRILIRAPIIIDANRKLSPGALLVEGCSIVAVGRPDQIGESLDWEILQLDGEVVMPAQVNVHAHLDLSHIGPVPYTGDFASWVNMIRSRRAINGHEIAAAVRRGIQLAKAGGTALIGDIAGARSTVPLDVLRGSGLGGVSFLEVFGIGRSQPAAISILKSAVETHKRIEHGVVMGVQPHAPYSCGIDVYRAAAEMGRPIATHLAETPDELRLISDADGPLRTMLETMGVWDNSITGSGKHPIDHLAEALSCATVIAAHVNYAEEHHLDLLAKWGTTVAYCPRASEYFGHPQNGAADHRYRDMLARGINVALGTDSLVCLQTHERLSVLDEMRLLYARDHTDPATLIRMGTINGASALGFDAQLVQLASGTTAGIIALPFDVSVDRDPVEQVLRNDAAPRWIVGPAHAENSWHVG